MTWVPPPPGWSPAGRLPLPAAAPAPPQPTRSARRRRPLVVGAAAALICAVVCAVLAAAQFSTGGDPASVVRQYYQALGGGHASQALAFAANATTSADPTDYLTDEVLADQLKAAPMRNISVGDVSGSGGTRQVVVHYVLAFASGAQSVTDTVTVSRSGSRWQLASPAVPVAVSAAGVGSDRISFAGRPLPASFVLVFPGALPLLTDTPEVAVSGQPSVSFRSANSMVSVSAELTAAARNQVTTALQAALTRCLAPTSTDPLCPNVADGRSVPGSLHGTLTTPLAASSPWVALSSKGQGLITVTVDAHVNASWKVWNFENQQVPHHQVTTVTVAALSSVTDPNTTYWTGPGA